MEQIDILLATYNGEKYLKEQIDSILNQTYSNFRLLISDDCSKDGTRKILEEYEKKDNRIKVFYQEKNLGYVKNFEFLLKNVENKIFALSDQDDVWNENKVENTYNKLKETNSDLVFTDLEVVNQDLNMICPSFNDYMLLSRKINKCINSYELEYLYNCITGCTLMAKDSFLDKVLPIPMDSKYVIHDSWLGLIYAIYGKITYLNEKTIKYRQHGNNQVGTDKISHKFTKLNDVRDLFIDVKFKLFNTYVNNKEVFDLKLQKQNEEALEYFKLLKNKKYFNFKKWGLFFKIYKNETFKYKIENFCILNLPLLTRVPFGIRHVILKILGKR